MNVFVVTPYFNTPADWLAQCHRSVLGQTVPASHVVVCDGAAPAVIADFQGTHVILRRNYGDYGNTPRLIGCFRAVTMGADAIAFLDADNWFYPEHLAGVLAHARANGLGACSSGRMLHRLDGSRMIRCPHVNGTEAIDTSCLVVLRPAFQHLLAWVLGKSEEAGLGDQFIWQYLRGQGVRTGFLDRGTVAYRTRHRIHYELAGETPPPHAIERSDPHAGRYA